MSTRIEDLTPDTQKLYHLFAGKLADARIPFIVVYTLRTTAEQQALYAQGRKSVDEVNKLRKAAGMPLTTDRGIVTNCDGVTKKSNHQTGRAFDLTFADNHRAPNWPSDPDRWFQLGEIGESCGLRWGGRWEPFDKSGLGFDTDHFELPV